MTSQKCTKMNQNGEAYFQFFIIAPDFYLFLWGRVIEPAAIIDLFIIFFVQIPG